MNDIPDFTFRSLWARLDELYGARPLVIAEDGSAFDAEAMRCLVEALMGLLASEGVGPGERVAFWADNHVEYLAALWATWLLGGVAAPLDVLHSPEQLEPWLKRVAPRVLFVDRERWAAVAAFDGAAWCFDDAWAEAAEDVPCLSEALAPYWEAAPPPLPALAPNAPMALLFTSGTTGEPKGCLLSHEGLLRSAWNMGRSAGWTSADRLLSMGGFFSIAGLRNVALAGPFCGLTMVLGGLSAPGGGLRALDWALTHEATVLTTVPAFLQTLLAHSKRLPEGPLGRVRQIIVGGTKLQAHTAARLEARFQLRVWTQYGQTELCGAQLQGPFSGALEDGELGRPINGEVRVVNEAGQPVEPGEFGELWLKSDNVMLGFFKGAGEPLSPPPLMEGWFPTQDWGRQRSDGTYELLSRLNDRFKDQRGEYLFAGEVEQMMERIPGVAEAAFVPVEESRWWLFVAPLEGEHLEAEGVLREALSRLAPQRAPSKCLVVKRLPRHTEGKLRRQALLEKYREPSDT